MYPELVQKGKTFEEMVEKNLRKRQDDFQKKDNRSLE